MAGAGKQHLREAMHSAVTNQLLVHHCAPLWCHRFLTRLKSHLTDPPRAPVPAYRAATDKYLGYNAGRRQSVVANVTAILYVMDDNAAMKEWLLKRAPVNEMVESDWLP